MQRAEEKSRGEEHEHYVFRREQVLAADVGDFIRRWDPGQFTAQRLRRAFGCLSLELEDVAKCGDAFTVPEARRLIGRLWGAFPWLGFYLAHDRAFGSAATIGKFPFLAIGLCLTNVVLVARDQTGRCEIEVNQHQLGVVKAQYLSGFQLIGRRSGLSPGVMATRSAEIARQLDLVLDGEG
jgi:hypothetical protein